MKIVNLIAGVLFCSMSYAQGGWAALPVANASRYDDVHFIDDKTGIACNSSGQIFKTTDGGKNWQLKASTNQYLRCIKFVTPQLIFCGAIDTAFYRSSDGGETWTDIAPTITPRIRGLCGLSSPDPATIVGVGVFYGFAFMIRSTDGGNTWTYINMQSHAQGLVEVLFLNKNEGFVSGIANLPDNGGILLYTKDGGQTWVQKARTILSGEYIWKIQSPDPGHFFASVQTSPVASTTRMFKSSDGGNTWDIMKVANGSRYIQAIGFIDSLHGWTGGDTTLFETKNGGSTWQALRVGRNHNRFQRINDTLAFLTGAAIYKYTDTTRRFIDLDPYNEVHALRLYPNPVDNVLNMRAGFDAPTNVVLFIISSSGQNMKEIFRGKVEKGKATYRANVQGWPKGTYYVVMHTNEGRIVRDFVR
jgi:photosystem II stability/assembly factor-like uncharacterized protein